MHSCLVLCNSCLKTTKLFLDTYLEGTLPSITTLQLRHCFVYKNWQRNLSFRVVVNVTVTSTSKMTVETPIIVYGYIHISPIVTKEWSGEVYHWFNWLSYFTCFQRSVLHIHAKTCKTLLCSIGLPLVVVSFKKRYHRVLSGNKRMTGLQWSRVSVILSSDMVWIQCHMMYGYVSLTLRSFAYFSFWFVLKIK